MNGRGGKNHQHTRAVCQCMFDRVVPALAGNDIHLIEPYVGAGGLQVCSHTKHDLGVFAAITEERC